MANVEQVNVFGEGTAELLPFYPDQRKAGRAGVDSAAVGVGHVDRIDHAVEQRVQACPLGLKRLEEARLLEREADMRAKQLNRLPILLTEPRRPYLRRLRERAPVGSNARQELS